MADASSVNVTSGDRLLVGPPCPAETGTGGVRRSACGFGTRDGRRTAGNAGGGNGGRSGRGFRRGIISEADNVGTSNNESIEGIGPDVWPLESVVHSREAGEIAGGWLVGASVHHVDLNAAWVVLGLSGRVKCNDLIANQVLTRGEPSGDVGSPLVAIGDQLGRGPLSICVPAFIYLEPFTIGSRERGTISVARRHESGDRSQVIGRPVGPLESHVASSGDVEYFVRTVFTALVTGNTGAGDVRHGTIAWNLTNDSSWNGARVRVGERSPPRLSRPVGIDTGNISVSRNGGNSSEQGSEDSEAAHG